MERINRNFFKPKKNHKGDSRSCQSIIFSSYKKGARKRGYSFELTREQFNELTKQNCWYCGQEPAQIKHARKNDRYAPKGAYYIYNGIDRVDNEVGYIEANCIPCCGRCNKMKGVLSGEDFIGQIRKIVHSLGLE